MEKLPINEILHGDTIELLKTLPNQSIDVIFADPPYFMQTDGKLLRINGSEFSGVDDEWDKFKDFEEYDSFCQLWLKECKRVLKSTGTIWVIGSFQNIYRLGYIMQNLDFWILNDVVWNKNNPVPNFGGTRFCNAHETLLWCSVNKNSKFTFNYKTMKYLNNGKQEKSVWTLPLCTGKERLKDENGKKVHSTQKPEELLYKVILSSTKPNDIILDPFFGTGTTGSVAKKLGRNFIGIEREQKYIKAATQRLNDIIFGQDNDEIAQLSLEVKPPKVTMKNLIDKSLLKENQILYNKEGMEICTILNNGHVIDKDNHQLSIHKMSAKHLNKVNHNGWDYFYIKRNEDLIPLNNLRYEYSL